MGLRPKVALMLVAMIVPISLAMGAWRVGAEHRAFLERRAERLASHLQRRPPRRCERAPQRFRLGRRSRGFVAFAYDENFRSLDPNAPRLPGALTDEVAESPDPVHRWFFPSRQELMGVTAVKTADSGPCTYIVLGWMGREAAGPVWRRAIGQTGGLAAILAVLGVLVAFPIVRRIRRLEDAVRGARDDVFDPELSGNDEINALATAFDETFTAVREREAALEQYIANTTHDLAIPLTVLQHRLEKMRRGVDTGGDIDPDDVHVALEESHYIASLIANMRAAAKLRNPSALELDHDVDWTAIVERVIQRHRPIAEQKGVELNWSVPDAPLVVRGEPTLAEQALSNLVQNAIQYNAAGGHVSVIAENGSGFTITVVDDGPGIPDALRAEVLQRGVRADDARTRNAGGQGFGLSIVGRVCELHGWGLELEHQPGLTVRLTA